MNNIVKKIYRSKDINTIQNKITLLGSERKVKFNALDFLSFRLLTTIFLTIILLFSNIEYFIIPFLIVIYYNFIYYYLITYQISKRRRKLDDEALTFFEVLNLTLKSGRNLTNSLDITCKNVDSELSREFKKVLCEVEYGKTLMEALDALRRRIPSETINDIILNIMQTSVFGNSIVETMNNQIDYLREKQIMEVKSEINKIPNKVSIISVVFIVPLILLIVLGPFLIDLL